MGEEEFDSLLQSRPFGRDDAMRADLQLRRRVTLAMALWGRTPGDLQRQLLAPSPEIPSGFDLTDLRELQRSAEKISAGMGEPQYARLSRLTFSSQTIFVGAQRFTAWEARCEIVRRAIEYLENR